MLPFIKIIAVIGIALFVLKYLKTTSIAFKTFQWLMKLIIAAALILIFGIIIGIL